MRQVCQLTLFLSLLTACSSSSGGKKALDYYNFNLGTTWIYKANFLGEEDTRTVVMGPQKEGFFTDDAGGRFAYDGEGVRDEHRYILKQPIQKGAKWHSVAAVGATELYEITEVGVACEGAGKKFEDCLVVRSTNPIDDDQTLENTMTFAKGVGLVAIRTELVKSGGVRSRQVEMKLTDYRPGQ